MLAISDLHVAYGQSEVLHGLNVPVAPNEIVADHGPQRHGQDHADEVADGHRADQERLGDDGGRRALQAAQL